MVPSLFVMNARGAGLQGQTLTLAGVSPTSIVFADRPVRAAGHLPTEALLDEWTSGDFAKDAPNATVSVLSKDGATAHDVVVELRSPHLEGEKLTFDVRVLEGDLAGADGPAAVFVDIIGMPLTPLSFAGVARRAGPTGTAPQPRPTGPTGTRGITRLPMRLILTHPDNLNGCRQSISGARESGNACRSRSRGQRLTSGAFGLVGILL
jgi:hypothetical protein